MINTEDFIKRLQKVMNYYGESASSFAEKIGVQRSSISHILSGRNKPSLDFILKILHTFPEVDLYWLFNGRGNFPSEAKTKTPEAVREKEVDKSESVSTLEERFKSDTPKGKTIERIVIFYTDGTFKNFNN